MSLAASIGHNSRAFGEDETLPPKSARIVDKTRAGHLLIAAKLASALFAIPRKRILGKRQSGEEGRILRRFLIHYGRGLGAPVWELALIFDLNRKAIGEEESAFTASMATHPDLEADADNLTAMVDYALKVDRQRFIAVNLSELEAELAAKKAIKRAREAADLLEAPTPATPPRIKPKTFAPEVEAIAASVAAKRRQAELETSARILKAIIEKGQAPSASKDARKAAADAAKALLEIAAGAKKKKRARKG